MPQTLPQLLQRLRRLTVPSVLASTADAALLDRFLRDRDEAAFTALVSRHGPMVLRLCRRQLRDAHAAEDAFQATFPVLARRAAAIRRRDSLAAWLHGVAYRVAAKARAAEAGRRAAPTADLAPADPRPDPLGQLTARELLVAVDEEVARLPEAYRLPLILCCLEGHTQEEAATLLGWSPGSVKGRLERGRKRLHARLVRRGLTLPAALAAVELSRAAVGAEGMANLVGATVRATMSFAAGAVSTPVLGLAEGVIQGMVLTKLKLGAALVLALGALVAVAGLAAYQAQSVKRPATQGEEVTELVAGNAAPPKPARADLHGDPLPPGAVARLGTVRLRHSNCVNSVIFSPDGKHLVSGSWDNTIRLWDRATGKELRRFRGHMGAVTCVALSADGKTLASAGNDGMARIWETPTGRELLRVRAHQGSLVNSHAPNAIYVALSPDGKTLASGSWDKTVKLWDATTGKELRRLEHEGQVLSLAFSPDGKVLASGGRDKTMRLWDAATGRELRRIDEPDGYVFGVAFSPDGKTLATTGGGDNALRLRDVPTGRDLAALPGHRMAALGVAFSPDGQTLASAGSDRTVRLWQVSTGKQLHEIQAHDGAVRALAFAPDGKALASGSSDRTIRLWDVATGKEGRSLPGHTNHVLSIACAPDGRTVASGGGDGTVRLWEAATGKQLHRLKGHDQPVESVAFSPDGKLLASQDAGGTACLWDAATGRELRRLPWAYFMAFSPDGKAVASGDESGKAVRLWEVATGQELRQFKQPRSSGRLYSPVFSPDGRLLAAALGHTRQHREIVEQALVVWEVAAGRELFKREGWHFHSCLAFSPHGKVLASGTEDGTIHFWEVDTGQEFLQFEGHMGGVTSVAFSPDGRTLVSGGWDCGVRFWDVATGKEVHHLREHEGFVSSVAFFPDGKKLASASGDDTVLVWDLPNLFKQERPGAADLSPGEVKTLWADLAGGDAPQAYRAIWGLTTAPRHAVPFLREHLRAVSSERIARLIADLDHDRFEVREQATVELERLVDWAEPALRKTLAGGPPPEVRQRVERVLGKQRGSALSPDALRALRAVLVLEQIGTPEAQQVLESLAKGALEAQLTQEAKASLERLARRPAGGR